MSQDVANTASERFSAEAFSEFASGKVGYDALKCGANWGWDARDEEVKKFSDGEGKALGRIIGMAREITDLETENKRLLEQRNDALKCGAKLTEQNKQLREALETVCARYKELLEDTGVSTNQHSLAKAAFALKK